MDGWEGDRTTGVTLTASSPLGSDRIRAEIEPTLADAWTWLVVVQEWRDPDAPEYDVIAAGTTSGAFGYDIAVRLCEAAIDYVGDRDRAEYERMLDDVVAAEAAAVPCDDV